MADPSGAHSNDPERDLTHLVQAFIGKNWDEHYAGAWRRLGSVSGLRPGTSWNWSAALFPGIWLAYRRQWLAALGVLLGSAALRLGLGLGILGTLAVMAVVGLWGDRLLLHAAWKRCTAILRDHGTSSEAFDRAHRAGGTAGFVVMMPVILFVIGIFLVSVLPKFVSPKSKAFQMMLRVDLRDFAEFQKQFHADSGRFATLPAGGFKSSYGVTLGPLEITDKGWTVTATHLRLPGMTCAVASGVPNPIDRDRPDGEVACR